MQSASNLQSKRTVLTPPKAGLDSKVLTKPADDCETVADSVTNAKTVENKEIVEAVPTQADVVAKVVEETARLSIEKKDDGQEKLEHKVPEATTGATNDDQSKKIEEARPEFSTITEPIASQAVQDDPKSEKPVCKPLETEASKTVSVEAEVPKSDQENETKTKEVPEGSPSQTESKKRSIDQISKSPEKEEPAVTNDASKSVEPEKTTSEVVPSSKKLKVEEAVQLSTTDQAVAATTGSKTNITVNASANPEGTEEAKPDSKSVEPSIIDPKIVEPEKVPDEAVSK